MHLELGERERVLLRFRTVADAWLRERHALPLKPARKPGLGNGLRGQTSCGRFLFVVSAHDPGPFCAALDGRADSGGYKVKDATGQSLAYVYGRESRADADKARRV